QAGRGRKKWGASGAPPYAWCGPERAPGWGTRTSVPVERLQRADRHARGRSGPQRGDLEHQIVEVIVGLGHVRRARHGTRVAVLEAHRPGVGTRPGRHVEDQRLHVAVGRRMEGTAAVGADVVIEAV